MPLHLLDPATPMTPALAWNTAISFVTFVLLYVLPADPVRQIAGRSATAETVESIRRQLGLNQQLIRTALDQRQRILDMLFKIRPQKQNATLTGEAAALLDCSCH